MGIAMNERRKGFTLIELVMVMVIGVLLVALVAGRVGHMPAFLSLETLTDRVQALLAEAQTKSLSQGKEIQVVYDAEKRVLSVSGAGDGPLHEKNCSFPEGIEVDFDPKPGEGGLCYRFFPDGSGDGPLMTLKLKGHARILRVSPLTGVLIAQEAENE